MYNGSDVTSRYKRNSAGPNDSGRILPRSWTPADFNKGNDVHKPCQLNIIQIMELATKKIPIEREAHFFCIVKYM